MAAVVARFRLRLSHGVLLGSHLSFSNLAAMGVIFWAYLHETVSPAYMTAYFLFGSLLCAGRQRHALIELGKFVARPANKKEE